MSGREFDYTPEEAHAIRVEAFGAIRRAIEVARYHDDWELRHADALVRLTSDSKGFCNEDDLLQIETSANSLWHHMECAARIRSAIRAAIKSDKP